MKFANYSQNYALKHRLQTLIIRSQFEFWVFFHFPSKTGNFELNLVWTRVGRFLEWGKDTLRYQSGYLHSHNHRFSKCSNIRLFWYITVVLKKNYCSQRTATSSSLSVPFMKAFHQRFFKQPEPTILGFWIIFFSKEPELPILWILKRLKNGNGQFFKKIQRTMQHWFGLWTKKMAKE